MREEQNVCREGLQANVGLENTVAGDRQTVSIQYAENGFIVTVGCKIFVAKEWLEVSSKLQGYWENPRKAEKELYK